MSKPYAVLLVEDTQHEILLRKLLKRLGWISQRMRVRKAPPGRGAAEAWVRAVYPLEVLALRRAHRNACLVVALDADTGTTIALLAPASAARGT